MKGLHRALGIVGIGAVLGVAAPAWSRTIEGVRVDEKVRVLGREVILNGAALLEATVLNIDIYVVSLYLTSPEKDPKALLKCDRMWHIQMRFMRDIGRDRLREGWRDEVDDRPERHARGIDALLTRLVSVIPGVREGDVQTLTYDPDAGLSFASNGKVLFRAKDRTFARMLLRGYVDPKYAASSVAPRLLGR